MARTTIDELKKSRLAAMTADSDNGKIYATQIDAVAKAPLPTLSVLASLGIGEARTYLDRIDTVNPRLNAVVQVRREAALREARAADAPIANRAVSDPGIHCHTTDRVKASAGISCAVTTSNTASTPTAWIASSGW